MKKPELKSLEMSVTVPELFKCWESAVACKNIHWISGETLEQMASTDPQVWRWTLDSEQNVLSHKPVMLDRLFELWKHAAAMALEAKVTSQSQPRVLSHGAHQHIIVPVFGPQDGQSIGFVLFEEADSTSAKTLAKAQKSVTEFATHIEFCWLYGRARAQSYMDDLTSLYNQRYLPAVFEREISRMSRYDKKFSVLFMDIDFFKRVNDTRGHWIGSRLLIEVAKLIKTCTRACDYSFRYGGDEFVIVLVDTTPENSHKVAERIRKTIEQHEFVVGAEKVNLTVSIGLAVFPDHAKSTVELIQLADQAMYDGKRKSRNIVFLAG